MQLPVFRTIAETLCLLDKKNTQLEKIHRQVTRFWLNFFIDKQEAIVDVTSRVKGKESLREKIIRNRLYIEKDSPQQILADLSDLIGFCLLYTSKGLSSAEQNYQRWFLCRAAIAANL